MRILSFAVGLAMVLAACGDNSSNERPDAGIPDAPVCTQSCDDGNVCNGTETCTDGACKAGTPLPEGANCGTGMTCQSGECRTSLPQGLCGNGKTDDGEECDDGNNVNGDGCDACKYTCLAEDAARNCASADMCTTDGTCGLDHVCIEGTPLDNGTPCDGGANYYCKAGACTAPMCGNKVVEPGEECDETSAGCKADCTWLCDDDPATQCADLGTPATCLKLACTELHTCAIATDTAQSGMSCDATNDALVCVAGACGMPGCGDGVRAAGEECDDGNDRNLDGCDSACKLEQAARITSLQQQFAADDFCTANALGAAIGTPDAQSTIQATWDFPVSDGRISVVFKFLDLSGPLTTTGNATFKLGFVNAAPMVPYDGGMVGGNPASGNNDLDWWYQRELTSVDANDVPLVQLPGQVTNGQLTAGPGTISLKLLFAFEPAQVQLFNSRVQATFDAATSAPTVATGDAPPGHLASEHLDPALQVLQTSPEGAMCADVSVKSLYDTPIPQLLQLTCTSDTAATMPEFTPDNRLLDVFLAGCDIFGNPGISATPPDGSIDGATYHFEVDAATRKVASCTRNGAPATIEECVANTTYSSYFKFASGRVIIRRPQL